MITPRLLSACAAVFASTGVFASTAAFALATDRASAVQSPAAPSSRTSAADVADEATRLAAEFAARFRAYEQKRIDLSRGGKRPDPGVLGPHPALAYAPRFRALVERGSTYARVWWLENLAALVDASQPEERARVLVEHATALVLVQPGDPTMHVVLDALRTQRMCLGFARADELAERIASASSNPEVCARATWTRAVLRTPDFGLPGARPDDPAELARREEAVELHRVVLASWPKTAAARDSAAALYPGASRAVGERLASWIAHCAELQRTGVELEHWPRAPLGDLEPEFLALASAGHGLAKRWLETFYARWQDHLRSAAPRFALMELAYDLCFDYPDPSVRFTSEGLALYELLFRAAAERGALDFVLDRFTREAERLPVDVFERTVAPLRERSRDAHVHAVLLHVLVRSALATGEYRNFARALAWRDELVSRAPADVLAEPTRALCAPVEALLDGRPAPELSARDGTGETLSLASARGQVVLVVFFDLFSDPELPDARAWQTFLAEHAGRPFTVLGVNAGPMDARGLAERMAKFGATWRNALVQSLQDELLARWLVKRFPTTVVVDADGVLRGRDLAWSELRPLLERLVVEAESRRPR